MLALLLLLLHELLLHELLLTLLILLCRHLMEPCLAIIHIRCRQSFLEA